MKLHLLRLAGVLVFQLASVSALAAPPPAESFARLPALDHVRMSPNGELLAWAVNSERGTDIQLHSLATGSVVRNMQVNAKDGLKLRHLRWADNETVLATLSVTETYNTSRADQKTYEFFRIIAIDTRGEPVRGLLARTGVNYFTSAGGILLLDTGVPRKVIVSSPNYMETAYEQETGTRLAGSRETSGVVFSLFEADTGTGSSTLLEGGTPFTVDWVVDGNARPVAYSEWNPKNSQYWIKIRRDEQWVKAFTSNDYSDLQMAAMGLDGQSIVAIGANGGAHQRAWQLPLEGGEIVAMSPEDKEVEHAIVDLFTGRVIGLQFGGLKPTIQWLDPQVERIQRIVHKAFAGKVTSILDVSRDYGRTLVGIEDGNSAPVYYLVDLRKGTADTVGEAYPELIGHEMGQRELLHYAARDGLSIPAYLTLPPGRPAEKLPLVVLPHGGPASRDEAGFDWWSQFLATRGYAVLQPQFRGSTGFGRELEAAGTRNWGKSMQDDLLDGIDELAKRGVVDPARVCVVGASYGGFSALAGVTLVPDRFACAVSVNGVTDLGDMYTYIRNRSGDESDALDEWERLVGTPFTEDALSVSPAKNAQHLRAPVLLIHGKQDTVVPYGQAEIMARAFRQNGKPYELVTLENEDHWLSTPSARLKVLQAIEKFLAAHLDAPGSRSTDVTTPGGA